MVKPNTPNDMTGVAHSPWVKVIPAGMGPWKSMLDVRAHNPNNWFSPDTMRWWRSNTSTIIYGGRFFVTSEQAGYDAPRLYSVRVVLDDATIETMGEFQAYATRDEAHAAAIRFADAVEAGHTLLTDEEHALPCEPCDLESYASQEPNDRQLDTFTAGYAYAMIWVGREVAAEGVHRDTGKELHPQDWQTPCPGWELDAFSDDDATALSGGDSSRETVQADAENFLRANLSDLRAQVLAMGRDDDSDLYREGSDFALTRNGHGAGFWDRGTGDIGERLSKDARAWGECLAWAYADGGPDQDVHIYR